MRGRTRWIAIGCGGLIAMVVFCGCAAVLVNVLAPVAGLPPLVATVPPATAAPPTNTPDPTDGLGATRAALEPRLDDGLLASFAENGRAWYLERQSTTGLDLEDELATLLPTDSQQTDTYPVADGDRTARVYHSDWLAGVFGDEQWGGADPGTFVVTFNASDPVTRIVIATGNNP